MKVPRERRNFMKLRAFHFNFTRRRVVEKSSGKAAGSCVGPVKAIAPIWWVMESWHWVSSPPARRWATCDMMLDEGAHMSDAGSTQTAIPDDGQRAYPQWPRPREASSAPAHLEETR